jgi:hypothetical protein
MLLTAGAARSWADTITFNNSSSHPDGTITIGNTVTLTNGVADTVARILPLGFFNITGTCGPLGDTNYGCLNLSTGAFVGPVTSTAGVNDYAYLGGGFITVTGAISSLGLGPGTVLWTGSFDPTSNVVLQFDDICQTQPTQCTGSLTGTLAPGTFNTVLATALGVLPTSLGGNDQNLFVQFSGISLPASGFPTGTAIGNTNQLQIITPGVVPNPNAAVPESGSLILVGMGLVAGANYLRRRKVA